MLLHTKAHARPWKYAINVLCIYWVGLDFTSDSEEIYGSKSVPHTHVCTCTQTTFSDKWHAKQEVLDELWKKLCPAARQIKTLCFTLVMCRPLKRVQCTDHKQKLTKLVNNCCLSSQSSKVGSVNNFLKLWTKFAIYLYCNFKIALWLYLPL